MIEEFLRSFFTLIDVMLAPLNEEGIDLYCKGMFFGLYGSSMLAKFANTLLRGLSFDEIRKRERERLTDTGTKKRTKKGGEFDLWKTIS
mgnify:CR=1 FL=1